MTQDRRLPISTDVARAAGVSRSTVSLVLNDTPGARIPGSTRARVLAAAADLGYVVNRAAADLRRGTSLTVLSVLDQTLVDSTSVAFLPVLAEALRESGLNLITAVVSGEAGEREAYAWAALRPVALIAFGASLTSAARAVIRAAGCVVVGDHDADVLLSVNQTAVAAAGVAAMHERGRRRLLQVLATDGSPAALTQARVTAFERAAGAGGLGTVRVSLAGTEVVDLVAAIRGWPVRPDGIVTQNDEYAAVLLGALLDAGVRVPGDIAVLGADNTAWGRWMRPALSTIALEPGRVIDQLLAVLDAIRSGEAYPGAVVLDPQARVLHRQTT